jgi:hypothetical protein
MQKTVFMLIASFACVAFAAGQVNTDSLQNKAIPLKFKPDSSLPKPIFLPSVIPADFYTTHLPFFCDKELKLQKAVKMPVKIRIGSVEACDRLEGKY